MTEWNSGIGRRDGRPAHADPVSVTLPITTTCHPPPDDLFFLGLFGLANTIRRPSMMTLSSPAVVRVPLCSRTGTEPAINGWPNVPKSDAVGSLDEDIQRSLVKPGTLHRSGFPGRSPSAEP